MSIDNMRKHIFLICLLLISVCNVSAQKKPNERSVLQALYRLELLRDTLNPKSKKIAITELLIYPDESWFRTMTRGVFDTLRYNQLPTKNTFQPKDEHELNYLIHKNYNAGSIRYYSPLRAIFQDYCFYDETDKALDWKITNDTLVRHGITLQKATLDYGNRKWTTYFNPEIPINDGPYKFCGLPGLIFEIWDETETWKFTLMQLRHSQHGSFDFKFLEKAKQMDKIAFHKLQRELFDNEVQDSEARGEIRFDSTADRQRAIDRRKEKSKHYNNPIELLRW